MVKKKGSATVEQDAPDVWDVRVAQGAALALLVLLGVWLRVAAVGTQPQRSPDERSFTHSAAMILQEGRSAFPELVVEFRADPGSEPPTRAGFLYMVAGGMAVSGRTDELAGAYLSCVASVLGLVVLTVFAWRMFGAWVALVAVLFYAVSPLELAIARRCWEEAAVDLLALVCVWIACEITRGARAIGWFVALLGAGAVCCTMKEVPAMLFGLCVAWVCVVLAMRGQRRAAGLFAGAAVLASGVAVLWLVYLLGDARLLVELPRATARFLETSQYSIDFESGPPWDLLRGFWAESPLSFLLACCGVAWVAMQVRSRRRVDAWVGLGLFAGIFLALAMVTVHHLNLRYVCVVFGVFYLFGGLGAVELLRAVFQHMKLEAAGVVAVIAVAGMGVCAWADHTRFERNFVARDMPDLSIRMLLHPEDRPPAVEAASVPQGTEAELINLSYAACAQGRYADCIGAARAVLQMDPKNAVAWNNIAAASEAEEKWDDAIDAARRAIALQPDFQLAKNNLAWSLEQKQKSVNTTPSR